MRNATMRKLLVLQSLWAMERRHTDGFEPTLEANIERIANAGYDGISGPWVDRQVVRRTAECMRGSNMTAEGMCFPTDVDDLKKALDIASDFNVQHLNVQPDVRPRRIEDCAPLIEGWLRLAEQVDFDVYIETHRDRMTTDLFFTLDLLDRFPDLPLLADLSHFLVAREFPYPVSAENHALIHRILDSSWAFHGRVASREQVQVEISFTHHRIWLELFLDWWKYGFLSWARRSGPNASLAFTCELGPKPYAITGRDGNDTTDRWAEALQLRTLVRDLWASIAPGVVDPA
jgi:hypothetical protein